MYGMWEHEVCGSGGEAEGAVVDGMQSVWGELLLCACAERAIRINRAKGGELIPKEYQERLAKLPVWEQIRILVQVAYKRRSKFGRLTEAGEALYGALLAAGYGL